MALLAFMIVLAFFVLLSAALHPLYARLAAACSPTLSEYPEIPPVIAPAPVRIAAPPYRRGEPDGMRAVRALLDQQRTA